MPTVTSTQEFDSYLTSTVARKVTSETFATIIAGAGNQVTGSSLNATIMGVELDASTTTNQFGFNGRVIMLFDTSSLPANATVTSAYITIPPVSVLSNLGGPTLKLVSASPASTSSIVAADYSTLGSTAFYSGVPSGSANTDLTLNSSGLANINIGGISKFGGMSAWDLAGSFTGAWNSGTTSNIIWAAFSSGTFAKLTVTYTQPDLTLTGVGSLTGVSSITTS